MTFDDRVRALEPLGFTPRQTRFLATVALHSGYCLRRQYSAFAGVAYGKNVCDFLDDARRPSARRTRSRNERTAGLIYHLHARAIYRALGEDDNRNRRNASAALIARKLMVLDFVLGAPGRRVAAPPSRTRWSCSPNASASRWPICRSACFAASKPAAASTTRYFTHKLPVAVAGDPPVAYFVYLATDGTGRGLRAVPHGPRAAARHGCRPGRSSRSAPSPGRVGRLRGSPSPAIPRGRRRRRAPAPTTCAGCFGTRQAGRPGRPGASVGGGDRSLPVAAANSSAPRSFDALYARLADARVSASSARVRLSGSARPARSVGQLVTERLTFDYSQFGSLPGVA